MKFLKNLFSRKKEITVENINEHINVSKYFCAINYHEHYFKFLKGIRNKDKVIAELFIFRAWTTQFSFRFFISKLDISEEIVAQVFIQGRFGKELLYELEDVDIEMETQIKYRELIDNRWQMYNRVFVKNQSLEMPLPTRQICNQLTEICNIQDVMKSFWICQDFLEHFGNVKQEALDISRQLK